MGLIASSFAYYGPLAQLVEHLTFNQVVEGSIPSRLTFLFDIDRVSPHISPHRLAWPRTPAFHAGDTGSNPVGDATTAGRAVIARPVFFVAGFFAETRLLENAWSQQLSRSISPRTRVLRRAAPRGRAWP